MTQANWRRLSRFGMLLGLWLVAGACAAATKQAVSPPTPPAGGGRVLPVVPTQPPVQPWSPLPPPVGSQAGGGAPASQGARLEPPASAPRSERQVHFPVQSSFANAGTPDPASPLSLVTFGLALLERNEPAKAAAFFIEAADLEGAASRGNDFRIACVAAAAAAYLQAGDLPSFQETAARLRLELDRFQAAAPDPKIALILAIADKLRGVRGPAAPQLPWPVQELLRQ